MKLIEVEVVKHEEQRYNTAGDWQFEDETLKIKVSDTGDIWHSYLLAIHELTEAILCKCYSITQEEVDKFDMDHPELDDPGEDTRAPYHPQHIVAMCVESMLANRLGIDWAEYEEKLERLTRIREMKGQ